MIQINDELHDVSYWAKDAAREILNKAQRIDIKSMYKSTPIDDEKRIMSAVNYFTKIVEKNQNKNGYTLEEIDRFNAANRKSLNDKIIDKKTATNESQEPKQG